MALSRKRYSYVDFTTQQTPIISTKTTYAVPTAADNQSNYFWVDGNYFEQTQTGALTTLNYVQAATGWTLPTSTNDGAGIELSQGILAGDATPMKFTVGTDAFFLRVKMIVTTLANTDVVLCGFRNIGAVTDVTSEATGKSVYNDKCIMQVGATGAVTATTSVDGTDVTTTATNTPIVSGTAFTFGIYVSAAGVSSFKFDDAADTLLDAASPVTHTSGDVMIPYLAFASTASGAADVELVTWECGLQ